MTRTRQTPSINDIGVRPPLDSDRLTIGHPFATHGGNIGILEQLVNNSLLHWTTLDTVGSVSVTWMVHSFASVKQVIVGFTQDAIHLKDFARCNQELGNYCDDDGGSHIEQGSQTYLFRLWVNFAQNPTIII